MDYPQRNTDAEEKIWIENADSGHGRPLPLMRCTGGACCQQAKKGNCYLQQPVNRRKHRLLQVWDGLSAYRPQA